jgi:hypothetical protein
MAAAARRSRAGVGLGVGALDLRAGVEGRRGEAPEGGCRHDEGRDLGGATARRAAIAGELVEGERPSTANGARDRGRGRARSREAEVDDADAAVVADEDVARF